jgi:hypothetical protein
VFRSGVRTVNESIVAAGMTAMKGEDSVFGEFCECVAEAGCCEVFECFTASCPDVGTCGTQAKSIHDTAIQTPAQATTPHAQ